jgi:hypothetical protein
LKKSSKITNQGKQWIAQSANTIHKKPLAQYAKATLSYVGIYVSNAGQYSPAERSTTRISSRSGGSLGIHLFLLRQARLLFAHSVADRTQGQMRLSAAINLIAGLITENPAVWVGSLLKQFNLFINTTKQQCTPFRFASTNTITKSNVKGQRFERNVKQSKADI